MNTILQGFMADGNPFDNSAVWAKVHQREREEPLKLGRMHCTVDATNASRVIYVKYIQIFQLFIYTFSFQPII